MFKAFLPFASKIIKDAVKAIPNDAEIGERLIEICLTVLAKAVKTTKTDVDVQLFEEEEEKQEELRERLKVVEKWVIGAAAVLAAGVTLIGFLTNISKAYL